MTATVVAVAVAVVAVVVVAVVVVAVAVVVLTILTWWLTSAMSTVTPVTSIDLSAELSLLVTVSVAMLFSSGSPTSTAYFTPSPPSFFSSSPSWLMTDAQKYVRSCL